MTSALLALGLVLIAATQLRPSGVPVGPGELLLIAWMLLAILRQVLCQPLVLNPAFRRVAVFWLVMVIIQCIGMMVGLVIEPFHYVSGILRDIIAYTLVLCFSLLVALNLSDRAERRHMLWVLLVLGSASLTLQVAGGFGLAPTPGTKSWYYDRLIGWAENPNQLGFFALIIVLLGLHLFDTAETGWKSVRALALSVMPFVAGMLSRSDSFMIGLMLSGALVATLKSISWVGDEEMAPSLRGTAVVLAVMALPLTIAASVPFASAALEKLGESTEALYGENEQGDTRLKLWAEALDKGLDAKLIGFGPGPHLTSKSYKRPPPSKFEAHNTLLDLFTQGGIVAVGAFIWITSISLVGVTRAKKPALAGLIIGLLVFSMFHYTVRHPIFWFVIVICLLEARFQTSRSPVASLQGKTSSAA
ncbi:O-antigen ligase-like membrane protein [Aliiruegeria haliotis]|uniref:O-antigen ligase-like membrane protein n=1 Tax=Aliiruegeria haliotis TaxID=1280846 RepID=A0A2T0RVM4_9RHOB|nr:O-antigen ligase family protein [Aliiruegeria haliotis]PRY25198.1 O-antigen ligase-like membrane protein [Aliiruegeria haliotis]